LITKADWDRPGFRRRVRDHQRIGKDRCCDARIVVDPDSHRASIVTSGTPACLMYDEITSVTGFDDARSIECMKSSAAALLYAFDAMYSLMPERAASSPMYDSTIRSIHAVLP